MRLAGKPLHGRASARVGDDSMLPLLASFLTHNKQDAKYYNVCMLPDGTPNMDDVRALLPQIVVVRVTVT